MSWHLTGSSQAPHLWNLPGELRRRWEALRADHLLVNSLYLTLNTVAMSGFGFAFWLVSSRLYSAEEIGLGTALISASGLLGLGSLMGFNSTFVRYLPTAPDRGDLLNTGFSAVAVASVALGAGYVAVLPLVSADLAPVGGTLLAAAVFIVGTAAVALNTLTDNAFVAFRAARWNLVLDGGLQSAAKLVFGLAFAGAGALGLFGASGAAAVVAVVASLVVLRRGFGHRPAFRFHRSVLQQVKAFASANYVAYLLNLSPVLVLPIVVINMQGAQAQGVFYIALMIANVVFNAAYSVSQSFFAEASYANGETRGLVSRAARLLLLLVLPASVLLACVAPVLLGAFGAAYSDAGSGALFVLALSATPVALYDICTAAMRARRLNAAYVVVNLLYCTSIIGLAVVWADHGLVGVATGWSAGHLLAAAAALLALRVHRRTRRRARSAPEARGVEPVCAAPSGTDVAHGERPAVPPVVHVCGYFPPHVGGIEVCAQQISRELVRRGVTARVVTSRTRGRTVPDEPVPPQVRRLLSVTFAHTPWMPTLPAVLMRMSRGSLLHLHVSHVSTDVVAAAVARLTRRPLVAHFHMDVEPSGPLGGVFTMYKRHVLGPVLRSAAHVVALSAEQRDLVVQRYAVRPDLVTVVPNGVADEYFVDEREPPPPGAPLRVLYVGRFAEQKKLDRLFAALRALDRPYRLDVVGDGELRDRVTAEARRMPEGRVVLWGALSGEDLRARYREADVFVLTSQREGMPVALLEAMAARLPIVANDVQGLREFVSGVGLLGDATDPAAFAGLLCRLADDPAAWRRLSDDSAAFAGASRWSVVVPRLEEVYVRAWMHRRGNQSASTSRIQAS